MKLLLDTHTFLWFSEDNPDLSPTAREHIEDTANICFISMGTIWEMAIKISIGKLWVSGLRLRVSGLMFRVSGLKFRACLSADRFDVSGLM